MKKKVIIITIIAIISLIIIFFVYNPKDSSTQVFEGDFNGDGKIDKLEIKIKSWNVYVPKDIADDTGIRSETSIFLNNKKISTRYSCSGSIEIIDYDKDGIDEIKRTYQAEPPGYGTWNYIYKIDNNQLVKIDSYRVETYMYTEEGYNQCSFFDFNNKWYMKYINKNQIVPSLQSLEEFIKSNGFIEIRFYVEIGKDKVCKIMFNNETIYEFLIDNVYSGFSTIDIDSDKLKEITNKDQSIIIKSIEKPINKEDILIIK